jgi:hypothetical protein
MTFRGNNQKKGKLKRGVCKIKNKKGKIKEK